MAAVSITPMSCRVPRVSLDSLFFILIVKTIVKIFPTPVEGHLSAKEKEDGK